MHMSIRGSCAAGLSGPCTLKALEVVTAIAQPALQAAGRLSSGLQRTLRRLPLPIQEQAVVVPDWLLPWMWPDDKGLPEATRQCWQGVGASGRPPSMLASMCWPSKGSPDPLAMCASSPSANDTSHRHRRFTCWLQCSAGIIRPDCGGGETQSGDARFVCTLQPVQPPME